jgi:hypothetical protein
MVSTILSAVKTAANRQPVTRIHCSASLSDNAKAPTLARFTVTRSNTCRLDMGDESCSWSRHPWKSSGGIIDPTVRANLVRGKAVSILRGGRENPLYGG